MPKVNIPELLVKTYTEDELMDWVYITVSLARKALSSTSAQDVDFEYAVGGAATRLADVEAVLKILRTKKSGQTPTIAL